MQLCKRLWTLVLPLLLAAAGIGLVAAPATAQVYRTGVFSLSYTDRLFVADAATDSYSELDFATWRDMGFPQPQKVPTDWVKYPWSSTIYAVTFFGSERDEWVWDAVTYAEWSRAGRPAARNAGWIEGSAYHQWGTSTELFVDSPDGVIHKLTGTQWRDAGYPAPERRSNEGFLKYSWHSTIVQMSDLSGGQGWAISYTDWQREDFPTPRVVTRIVGDQVYKNCGSNDIWYAGPGLNKKLTAAEWRAMGSPPPTVQGACPTPPPTPQPPSPGVPPRPSVDKNCGDFRSRAEAQAEFDRLFPHYGDIYDLDRDGDRRVCEWHKY